MHLSPHYGDEISPALISIMSQIRSVRLPHAKEQPFTPAAQFTHTYTILLNPSTQHFTIHMYISKQHFTIHMYLLRILDSPVSMYTAFYIYLYLSTHNFTFTWIYLHIISHFTWIYLYSLLHSVSLQYCSFCPCIFLVEHDLNYRIWCVYVRGFI